MLTRAQIEEMANNLRAQANRQAEELAMTRGAIQLCEHWLAVPESLADGEVSPPSSETENTGEGDDSIQSN